jgi:hypothetical protein
MLRQLLRQLLERRKKVDYLHDIRLAARCLDATRKRLHLLGRRPEAVCERLDKNSNEWQERQSGELWQWIVGPFCSMWSGLV